MIQTGLILNNLMRSGSLDERYANILMQGRASDLNTFIASEFILLVLVILYTDAQHLLRYSLINTNKLMALRSGGFRYSI